MDRFHFQPGAISTPEVVIDGAGDPVVLDEEREGYHVFDLQRGNTEGQELAFCDNAEDAQMIADALNALVRPRSKASAVMTPRQLDVARLLAQGLAQKEIAGALGVKHASVSQISRKVFQAIGARGHTDAALKLQAWDLD